MLEKIGRGNER